MHSLLQEPFGLGAPHATPETVLPVVLNVNDSQSPRDVIDALMLARFAGGKQPHAVSRDLDNVRDDATLIPAEAHVLREAVSGAERARLAVGDGWTLRALHWPRSKTAALTVTAETAQLCADIMAQATGGMTEPPPPADQAVVMGFWFSTSHGPRRDPRSITTRPWRDIRSNYARSAATELDRLVRVSRDSVHGRLILLYGPPGTGKTTLLRTLAWEWRDWCQFDCVLDPEMLFSNSAYLMEVALDQSSDCQCPDQRHQKWRLLLLEDCDELIRGEAKEHTGQALSRLLNLTDGLLGQGRKVLVAITTNEDVARLHPAVVRPGRCLARIEVPALPAAEARAWLGSSTGVPAGGATLAELYARRDGYDSPAVAREPVLSGQYL